MRPARNFGLAVIATAGAVSVPFLGWLPLALAASACSVFLVVDRRVRRSDRPEVAVLVGILLATVAVGVGIAGSGGPASPILPLMIAPVLGSAAVLGARGASLTLGVSAAAVVLATVAVDPSAFAARPALTLMSLTALFLSGLMAAGLLRAEVRHRESAVLDPLTGLLNRLSLPDRFAEIRQQAILNSGTVAVVLCDLDRFKSINDAHGHQVGDAVLRDAAYEMRRSLRSFELMYRVGGEEFLVVLPGASLDEATAIAERMRAAVARQPLGGIEVTVSAGVSGAKGAAIDLKRLIDEADAGLYEAKRRGRNQVLVGDSRAPVEERHQSATSLVGASSS